MSYTVDELLCLLAWEARLIELETLCAALGITRREAVDMEFRAVDEGKRLAEQRAQGTAESEAA